MESYIKRGDCLELMREIPDASIDMILADLPFGTTACAWDEIIPFDALWAQYNRIIKRHGVIALFGSEPFTSKLITSNLRGFKYRINWDKKIPSGMNYAKYRPMQQIEDICIFTSGGEKSNYYPIMIRRDKPIKAGGMGASESAATIGYKPLGKAYEWKNPTTLIQFMKVRRGALHPTQKPVELLEYLIKTYTKAGDVVLDNCMGSGSTCIAAIRTGRKYIGMELDGYYFEIARERIETELKHGDNC